MPRTNGRDPALEKALEEAGGVIAVAEFISEHYESITPQAVSKWITCPPRRARQVEAAVKARKGKTRAKHLCPELYGERAA